MDLLPEPAPESGLCLEIWDADYGGWVPLLPFLCGCYARPKPGESDGINHRHGRSPSREEIDLWNIQENPW